MFKGRHFDRSIILLCERWYLAYGLSLRDLEEMMAERGIRVDHATVHRWAGFCCPRAPWTKCGQSVGKRKFSTIKSKILVGPEDVF
jgi:transposase-like protein